MKAFCGGFTLIELLVVIAIIAILATVGSATFDGIQKGVKDTRRKTDVNAIAKAMEVKFNNGVYGSVTGADFSSGSIPTPPEGGNYYIDISSDNNGFIVCAALDGTANPCTAPSTTCHCQRSSQGTYIASGFTPTPTPTSTPTPTPTPTSTPTPTPTSTPTITPTPTPGQQEKMAIILANFQDKTTQPVTLASVNNTISTQIIPYYQEASYTKSQLTAGDAFGWYTLPITYGCEYDHFKLVQDNAIAAADPAVNFSNYKYVVIVVPDSASICGFGGLSSGPTVISTGEGSLSVGLAFVAADSNVTYGITHELGHLIGDFREGLALECGANSIGGSCSPVGYGDLFTIMGPNAPGLPHFNAYQKERLGWFDPSNIITATSPGTYNIGPIETVSSGPKIIKIPRDKDGGGNTTGWLYVEYRQRIGFDASAYWLTYSSNPTNGALIHYLNPGNDIFLLDATPGSQASPLYDRTDSALEVGNTFTDAEKGITITTLSKTSSNLEVRVNF